MILLLNDNKGISLNISFIKGLNLIFFFHKRAILKTLT